MLRFVNDSNRSIYAFEMLPPPSIDVPDDIIGQELSSDNCVANNTVTVVPKSSPQPADILQTCINDLVPCAAESKVSQSPVGDGFSADEGGDQLNNRMEASFSSAPVADVALLESNPDVNWQHNQLSDMAADDMQLPAGNTSTGSFGVHGMWSSDLLSEMNNSQSTSTRDCVAEQSEATSSSSHLPLHTDHAISTAEDRQPEDGGGDAETCKVADDWKSCVICLEEMEDDQLLVHAHCGGTLCFTCHPVYHLLITVPSYSVLKYKYIYC